jgi:hypothetical protein
MKSFGLSIQAILSDRLISPSPKPDRNWKIKQQGKMRREVTRCPCIHRSQPGQTEAASVSLIRHCGIEEPIAHDGHASCKSRSDDLADMLPTSCEDQQRFSLGSNRFRLAFEQDAAQLFRRLSRFPATFSAFQRDEKAREFSS